MAIEELTPEQVQAAIDGGYRAAGNVFRAFMDVLEARYGKAEAAAIGREAVRRKAQYAGQLAAARFGKGGLETLATAHKAGFAEIEVLELSPKRYVIRDHHCAIVEGWRASGLGEARVRELGDMYCPGDEVFAQAFNPKIKLEFQGRLAEGKPYCQWLFTLDE